VTLRTNPLANVINDTLKIINAENLAENWDTGRPQMAGRAASVDVANASRRSGSGQTNDQLTSNRVWDPPEAPVIDPIHDVTDVNV
jgi:hypothetical protein